MDFAASLFYHVLSICKSNMKVVLHCFPSGLSKAETQALTNYGSGEDENEDEEIEFEEGPVDVQTSLQASSETTTENEQVSPKL